MEKRIKFLKGEQKKFLVSVQNNCGLNVDGLAEIAQITPRSFRDWKREKLCMTVKSAEKFSTLYKVSLPEDIEVMKTRWFEYKRQIAKKGGISTLKKYGSIGTPEGRSKGGKNAIRILMEKGIVPPRKVYKNPPKDELFAEFIGILLGDGGITNGQVVVTLNSEADKNYVDFVVETENKLFGEKPKTFQRKNCKATAIYFNGIDLVSFLVKCGMKIGNKVKQQVDVPDWIKKVQIFRVACLRGLMDTDGGVFVHKYKVNGKLYQYKKICFTNRSVPLLIFIKGVLEQLGFTPKIITKVENKKVWLYNSEEVNRYLKVVGSHNTRLLRYNKIL